MLRQTWAIVSWYLCSLPAAFAEVYWLRALASARGADGGDRVDGLVLDVVRHTVLTGTLWLILRRMRYRHQALVGFLLSVCFGIVVLVVVGGAAMLGTDESDRQGSLKRACALAGATTLGLLLFLWVPVFWARLNVQPLEGKSPNP